MNPLHSVAVPISVLSIMLIPAVRVLFFITVRQWRIHKQIQLVHLSSAGVFLVAASVVGRLVSLVILLCTYGLHDRERR